MTDSELNQPEPSSQAGASLGTRLSAARRALDLSVGDVARQIKLSVAQVEALETGNYARLPKSSVIVRGFVRNYARLVHLDPEPLLAALKTAMPHEAEPAYVPRMRPMPVARHEPRPWLKYVMAGLAVLVGLAAYGLYTDPGMFSDTDSTTKQSTAQAPKAAPAAPPTQIVGSASAPVAEAPPSATAGVPGTLPAGNTAAANALSTIKPDPAVLASGPNVVRLAFTKESWVEIRDRDGVRIFSQTNPAGSERSVQGMSPLSLSIGNASGVAVFWKDQPVNLAPHINRIDVARLKLE